MIFIPRGAARAVAKRITISAAFLMSLTVTPLLAQPPDAVNKGACMTCHALDKKVVGPAFQAIAQKYKSDSEGKTKIEDSIRKGSSGKWGAVPMPPNSALKDDDVKVLITWILSL